MTDQLGWERLHDELHKECDQLRSANLFRSLTTSPIFSSTKLSQNEFIDLTHNDYLGLRFNLNFNQMVKDSLETIPIGSGGSRLLGGEHPEFTKLEQDFSEFKGVESSLYFGSGYGANHAIISVLSRPGYAFFSDALNHASIVDGMKLSKQNNCDRYIYRHCDYDHLEQLLSKSTAKVNVIYTESIFSMDGDVSDLIRLSQLADRYCGVLVVDEAHSIGVRGIRGSGELSEQGLSHEKIITMNTCGKALACQGALVCGPSWFRDAIINTSRSFIYTTAPSPIVALAVRKAIECIVSMDRERTYLRQMSNEVRKTLEQLGLECGASSTHIIPIILGGETASLEFASRLQMNRFFVKAIRPPTVPQGASRVRLSLNSSLSSDDVYSLQETLKRVVDEDQV